MEQKDKIKCQVSAFMDGEVAHEEVALLCKQLGRDVELRDHWRDYHLISDAMKKQLPAQMKVDLSMRIHDAIDNEAALLPQKSPAATGFVKRLSGFAVAASVAVLGVMAVTNMTLQSNGVPAPQLAANTADLNSAHVVATVPVQSREMDPRLNKYLLDHSEYSVNASLHGVLPYARIVGQQQDRK